MFISDTYADDFIVGTGGGSSALKTCDEAAETENNDGTTHTTGTAYYNCCPTTNERCPRWIKGPIEAFAVAWKNRVTINGQQYDENAALACMNPNVNTSGIVYWFGDVRHSSKNNETVLFNWTTSNNKLIMANGYTFTATGVGHVGGFSLNDLSLLSQMATNRKTTVQQMAFACKTVNDPETPPPPAMEENNGCGLGGDTTDVVAGIRVIDFATNSASDWQIAHSESSELNTSAFVWAKPNDIIQIKDCYYSGIQSHYYDTVVKNGWRINSQYLGNVDYDSSLNRQQDHSISGIEVTELHNNGWGTNGYTVNGFVLSSYNDKEDASPKEYIYSNQITVSAANNLGNNKLDNNWQQIRSNFRNGERQVGFGSLSYTPSWSCNPWTTPRWVPPVTTTTVTTSQFCSGSNQKWTYTHSAESGGFDLGNCVTTKEAGYWTTDTHYSTCSINGRTSATTAWFTNPTAIASTYFKVPYNYQNSGYVSLGGGEIYTGETVTIKDVYLQTSPRQNDTTRGLYATSAPNSKWVVAGYISDSANGGGAYAPSNGTCYSKDYCQVYDNLSREGVTLNGNNDYGGSETSMGGGTYNLWDVGAGKYYCVTVMVYPSASNGDTDMDGSGNGAWNNSASVCKVISKKPTFQVYGGSIYVDSGSVVQNYSALKNNIANVTDFNYKRNGIDNSGNIRKFYSWSDQGLIIGSSLQTYKNFATGAAANLFYGTASSAGGILANQGAIESTMRTYQPLTMPSMSISSSSGAVNFAGVGASLSTSFRQTVSKIVEKESTTVCNIDSTVKLNKGQDNIFYCNGTMTISGNIEYAGTYGSSADVPMAIIYAKNINIMPNVTRIDGWIIAEDTIDTCANASNACNNPLTIRGTVSATKLKLNRTYGAESGTRSSEPAELFIYSASALINSRSGAESSSDNLLQTVYTRELAPRY